MPPADPAPSDAATGNRVLDKMLDRLLASLTSGPSLNCRPHRSRQRVDWSGLSRLGDLAPDEALRQLFGEASEVKLTARTPMPKRTDGKKRPGARRAGRPDPDDIAPGGAAAPGIAPAGEQEDEDDEPLSPAERAWAEQNALLAKLRIIADDARTYAQDTGVHVLNVGFPLLSLPPGAVGGPRGAGSRRVLAPVAFIPVTVTIGGGASQWVKLACHGEGLDRVAPNAALLAWLEQQTGKSADELFGDEDGADPWREIGELVRHVCDTLDLPTPGAFAPQPPAPEAQQQQQPRNATPETAPTLPLPREDGGGGEGEDAADDQTAPLRPPPDKPRAQRSEERAERSPGSAEEWGTEGPEASARPPHSQARSAAGPAFGEDAGDTAGGDLPGSPLRSQGTQGSNEPPRSNGTLAPCPRGDSDDDEANAQPAILMSAVLGLFPMANQGLLRDMQAMAAGEAGGGPVQSFLEVGVSLETPQDREAADARGGAGRPRVFAEERLVAAADPFQARAVRLARQSRGLVVHGPPGTGKSQTITNIIGDHLARGQRVLLVCEKRTALDVVADRLEHMGVGRLCALVHDPQRDQRDLYRAIREQLDELPDTNTDPKAEGRLAKVDAELQKLHSELTAYHRAVMHRRDDHDLSFHELVGQWLALAPVDVVAGARPPASLPDKPQAQRSEERAERSPGSEAQGAQGAGGTGEQGDTGSGSDPALPSAALRSGTGSNKSTGPGAVDLPGRPIDSGPNTNGGAGTRNAGGPALEESKVQSTSLAEVDQRANEVRDILRRAESVGFARNPWTSAAGSSLTDLLARPMESVRSAMAACVAAANEADATAHPSVPPFAEGADLAAHAQARAMLAEQLQAAISRTGRTVLVHWAGTKHDADALRRARQKLTEADAFITLLRAGPLDAELALQTRDAPPDLGQIAQQLLALAAYLDVARKWWGFFAFRQKSAAAAVLNRYGLTRTADNAERLHRFLTGLRGRLALRDLLRQLSPHEPAGGPLQPDDMLDKSLADHAATLDLLLKIDADPALAGLADAARGALASDPATPHAAQTGGGGGSAQLSEVVKTPSAALIDGLRRSTPRAAAVAKLEKAAAESRLFAAPWWAGVSKQLRAGQYFAPAFAQLADRLDTVEGVLRVRAAFAAMPASLRPAVERLVAQMAPPDEGLAVLRRETLAVEIGRRLRADANLQGVDGQRLRANFDRYRELDGEKKSLVRDAILHRWTQQQKNRLLAATGSRLNGDGADVRRRLTTRGERAMRLRQVLAVGRNMPGGDPVFDLRPVWMASPETVAQIFPREPIFDVVVFDEASQCRLEEALPVLVRGRRVTIAGDPQQLPPTRFFESAVAQSEGDVEEVETDQQLFEIQQGETEDLLGAALGLDIQQCYLDVHYRSRNADLIEFSNEHFYGSRLQAIPGHPKNRPPLPPLKLYRAGGTYTKNRNEIEAQRVCEIVRDLLKRPEPPSIGIACFNLRQRDLIVETLDEMAEEDRTFAKRLAEARERKGAGSFEGLFVKNLENVQGDERDHIIISTTYGPDPKTGKFYRRFGPVGRAGGGRRLNVLVTRARQEVHLVTSIPAQSYRSLPPVPPGQTPGGGYLLFAYLQYAEALEAEYQANRRTAGETGTVGTAEAEGQSLASSRPDAQIGEADSPAAGSAKPQAAEPLVRERPSKHPSPFARSLAQKLADATGVGSDVHWGNEGFGVDLALHHPDRPGDVTVGVLCDATRFAAAEDPVEWDAFRTAMLEGQGWRLHRVWSPHFFRDPRGTVGRIVDEARATERTAAPDGAARTGATKGR